MARGDVGSLRVGAVRRIEAGIADSSAERVRALLDAVPGLHDLDLRTHADRVHVAASLDGDIDPLVKALARLHVVDLAIEEPDLEESVLRLYGDGPRGGARA